MKIALCDDDQTQLDSTYTTLKLIGLENNLNLEILNFTDSTEFSIFLTNNPNFFDIIFIDIIMPNLTGIDLCKKLHISSSCNIVFITSSKEYLLDSYNLNAYNYLIKPPSKEKLKNILLNINTTIKKPISDYIYITINNSIQKIDTDSILYINSNLRKVTINCTSMEAISFYEKLDNLEKTLLDKNFIRIHRSFIVNLKYIKEIHKDYLLFQNNNELTINRKYYRNLINSYMNYIKFL